MPIEVPPKAVLFSKLTEEGDDCNCSVLVVVWQIDFVAKNDQPFVGLFGSQNYSVVGFDIFAIMVELLQDQTGSCGRGKVDEDHFEVVQGFYC